MRARYNSRYGRTGSFQRPPDLRQMVLDDRRVVRVHPDELAAVPFGLVRTVVHPAVQESDLEVPPVGHVLASGVAELPGLRGVRGVGFCRGGGQQQ